jgi:hypothetical protein
MTGRFDEHIIPGQIDLADRFEHKTEVLSKLYAVSKEFEGVIWEGLKNGNFIAEYELCSANFKNFKTFEFAEDYDIASRQLMPLKETAGRVLLTWYSAINPIVTDIATFVDNWDDFFYPSSEDLIVIDEGWDWIAYFAHYECLFFGQGIISPCLSMPAPDSSLLQ